MKPIIREICNANRNYSIGIHFSETYRELHKLNIITMANMLKNVVAREIIDT